MKDGPDISRIAALIGDPARASILTALLSGRAPSAGELACEAGIAPATASGHLAQLTEAGLIWPHKQGRHRYFALAGDEVASALETLSGLAAAKGHLRSRPGPRDAALREIRVCYDHMAGARAVAIFDSLAARGYLTVTREDVAPTDRGAAFFAGLGIPLPRTGPGRRPLCRACLDWSERRSHLAGALGAALLTRCLEADWLRRPARGRHLHLTPAGAQALAEAFPT
ncbi:ArsR/SmtB family transcription factor [Rhodovulum visakhapatnamense]|uniref:ArsR family transcriptional regulator n=1 Tax=Rhodovulum visakhapatnamense TaxID=364297 RepID=A0A4V3GSQ4_9RHOB|nr:winged helix-turn-helix domain-containing protein [Rhodovulum visakhapatnamense]TDX23793.1 ArsR family transcriptional regulator [Rhodovulum visakhapatnamense]